MAEAAHLFQEPTPRQPLTLVDIAPAERDAGELAIAAAIVRKSMILIATVLWRRWSGWWRRRVSHSLAFAWCFGCIGWGIVIAFSALHFLR